MEVAFSELPAMRIPDFLFRFFLVACFIIYLINGVYPKADGIYGNQYYVGNMS